MCQWWDLVDGVNDLVVIAYPVTMVRTAKTISTSAINPLLERWGLYRRDCRLQLCVSWQLPGQNCECDWVRLVDSQCQDIDECDDNACPEGAQCTNEAGGFQCECAAGMRLDENFECTPKAGVVLESVEMGLGLSVTLNNGAYEEVWHYLDGTRLYRTDLPAPGSRLKLSHQMGMGAVTLRFAKNEETVGMAFAPECATQQRLCHLILTSPVELALCFIGTTRQYRIFGTVISAPGRCIKT